MIALTLLLCLACSFFTGIIGVHAIFGAFMAGLICPHEGGFAIKVAEKIEDLVGALFLPLYFTLSGLNTNIGLLDSGIVWAYVVGVIAVAFFSKFFGATIAARWTGMLWRECFAIGSLMSCKGLVELIVLVSLWSHFLMALISNHPRILDSMPRFSAPEPSPFLSSWHSSLPSSPHP
jgi:Kef-type K+ transport system membrane component KefB